MTGFIDGVYAVYWPMYEKIRQTKQEKEKQLQQSLKIEKASQVQLSIAGLKNLSDILSTNRKSDKGKNASSLADVQEKSEPDDDG